MTPSDLHRLYAAVIGALLLIVGLAWWRHDVSQKAIQAYQLHALDSTKTKQIDSVARTSRLAQDAEKAAQAAKTQALRQVAAGEALRAKQDSLVKVSANARADAEKALADSQATVATLRGDLSRLVSATRADSAAHARTLAGRDSLDRQLWRTISAGSLALTAEQRRSQSLQALTETLTKEIALVRKSQPSFVSNHLGAGVGYGCGVKGCEPVAAVIVRVLP